VGTSHPGRNDEYVIVYRYVPEQPAGVKLKNRAKDGYSSEGKVVAEWMGERSKGLKVCAGPLKALKCRYCRRTLTLRAMLIWNLNPLEYTSFNCSPGSYFECPSTYGPLDHHCPINSNKD
jgi:hypothetical protein